jgi:hypothetical protein
MVLFVIGGMSTGFRNGGGMKGRNRDWIIKSNYFLYRGGNRRYREGQK